jgi:integrase
LPVCRKIEKRDAHEMARRASQVCGQVLRYAVQTGRIKHNFIPDLKGALVGRQSVPFAAIEPDEIPALLKAMNNNDARLFWSDNYGYETHAFDFRSHC